MSVLTCTCMPIAVTDMQACLKSNKKGSRKAQRSWHVGYATVTSEVGASTKSFKCNACQAPLWGNKQLFTHITGLKHPSKPSPSVCGRGRLRGAGLQALIKKYTEECNFTKFWEVSSVPASMEAFVSHMHTPSAAQIKKADEAFSSAIIQSGAFLTADHPDFKKTFEELGVKYTPPSRKRVRAHLDEQFDDSETLMDVTLDDSRYVQTSTDGWTDLKGDGVTGIMALTESEQFMVGLTDTRRVELHGKEHAAEELERAIERLGGEDKVNGEWSHHGQRNQDARCLGHRGAEVPQGLCVRVLHTHRKPPLAGHWETGGRGRGRVRSGREERGARGRRAAVGCGYATHGEIPVSAQNTGEVRVRGERGRRKPGGQGQRGKGKGEGGL